MSKITEQWHTWRRANPLHQVIVYAILVAIVAFWMGRVDRMKSINEILVAADAFAGKLDHELAQATERLVGIGVAV